MTNHRFVPIDTRNGGFMPGRGSTAHIDKRDGIEYDGRTRAWARTARNQRSFRQHVRNAPADLAGQTARRSARMPY